MKQALRESHTPYTHFELEIYFLPLQFACFLHTLNDDQSAEESTIIHRISQESKSEWRTSKKAFLLAEPGSAIRVNNYRVGPDLLGEKMLLPHIELYCTLLNRL